MSGKRSKFDVLNDWPEVDLDPQGIFKYVLIEAYAEENGEVQKDLNNNIPITLHLWPLQHSRSEASFL